MLYTVAVNEVLEKTAACLAPYKDKKLAIGVSGGRDSMCLLHAAINCGIIDRAKITVAHVNHCLRATADRDQEFVRSFCEKNGIKFKAFRVDVHAESAKNGHTVEQAARNLRYEVFYGLISSGEADAVLTAHHALDNAETILMHLFRGAGLDGLRGMGNCCVGQNDSAQSTGKIDACTYADMRNNVVLRPFINVYPDELDRYAQDNNIEYVIDETNFVDDADRNFIRLNVIPLIEQRYRGAVRALNEFAGECAAACAALDGAVDFRLIERVGDGVTVKDDALSGPVAGRYIRRALEYFTTVDITREQIMRVTGLKDKRTGAVVELSNGIKAAREYGGIELYVPRPRCFVELPIKTGANFIDGLAVDITEMENGCAPRNAIVDLDKISGATLRFRRDGDRFTPSGGKSKKLKQFFIDNKIPCRDRDRLPLICRGSEVLAIVGVRVSESAKPDEKTVRFASVTERWR